MKRMFLPTIMIFLTFFSCRRILPEVVHRHYTSLNDNLSFNNTVRPILSDRCFSCHGPDSNTRKADLRLDEKPKEAVFDQIMDRILSEDPEQIMPPPDSKMLLSPEEKAILLKWINEGAKYEQHWAFIPPIKVKTPKLPEGYASQNEIDHFIAHKLKQNDLSQSKIADKEHLLRRVSLDLTGLPPTIAEMDAFHADKSDQAYETVVNKLMASSAFGERLAMEWMDVSRYADSHGLHVDGARMMWPWRDWVINAFNENMSYKDFVSMQIAGDMVPNATYEQKLATAFNRNHTMTAEGGAIDEEFRLLYAYDRTETFATVFLGLTVACARCHDHKFDPITQREFYELNAYFNNVKDLGMSGNDGNTGPLLAILPDSTHLKLKKLDQEIKDLSSDEIFEIKEFIDLTSEEPIFYGKIDTLVENKIDNNPNFTSRAKSRTQTLLGTTGEKNDFWRGWDFYLDRENRLNVRLISNLPHNYIHARTSEEVNLNQWTKVAFSYDGTGEASGLKFSIDDRKVASISLYSRLYKSIHPITYGTNKKIERKAIRVGKSNRLYTGENGVFKGRIDEIKIYHFPKKDSLRKKLSDKINLLEDVEEIMVMEEMEVPRKSFLYNRGEYDQPTIEVFPSTPAVLHKYPESVEKNRSGLAEWLFSEENTLTARVTVNRYWQMIFGTGLVSSANDFGIQGSKPSHPELLDYLALEFIENEWDIKWLLKKIVTSYTYQQSSTQTEVIQEIDPKNLLLSRGPSFRLQAEMIRDNALAASGLLTKKIGGESVKPYQPEGLWIEKSSFSKRLTTYQADHNDSLYRRSLYTFIRRTSPNPTMTIFDTPSREICVVKRENTSTPLQALVLLNDPQFVEAARAMAERIQVEGGLEIRGQIQYAFRLTTGRKGTSREIKLLEDLYKQQYNRFLLDKKSAKAFISVGEFRVPVNIDIPKTAALATVASTLLNHNETYMKR